MTEPSTGAFSAGTWAGPLAHMLIALALFSAAAACSYLAYRRRQIEPTTTAWPAALVALFLATLAIAHLIGAWTGWQSRAADMIATGIAALAGIAAAIALWRVVPALTSLPSHRELQACRDALAQARGELETFTASVSHDLRAPLTSIAGQAGMLELTLAPHANEEQRRRLQRLQLSVKQMSELIDALVLLSRTVRLPFHARTVDVSAMAEEIVADLRRKDPHRDVDVTIQPGMRARGDPRLLGDAFLQLIGNAWKFTSGSSGARIEIGQAPGEEFTFHVRDNGIGFDMAYGDRLFQPFKRLHAPGEFEGAGVGLAMASRIVERHRGRIWAEAKPNAGAVFYIELPPS